MSRLWEYTPAYESNLRNAENELEAAFEAFDNSINIIDAYDTIIESASNFDVIREAEEKKSEKKKFSLGRMFKAIGEWIKGLIEKIKGLFSKKKKKRDEEKKKSGDSEEKEKEIIRRIAFKETKADKIKNGNYSGKSNTAKTPDVIITPQNSSDSVDIKNVNATVETKNSKVEVKSGKVSITTKVALDMQKFNNHNSIIAKYCGIVDSLASFDSNNFGKLEISKKLHTDDGRVWLSSKLWSLIGYSNPKSKVRDFDYDEYSCFLHGFDWDDYDSNRDIDEMTKKYGKTMKFNGVKEVNKLIDEIESQMQSDLRATCDNLEKMYDRLDGHYKYCITMDDEKALRKGKAIYTDVDMGKQREKMILNTMKTPHEKRGKLENQFIKTVLKGIKRALDNVSNAHLGHQKAGEETINTLRKAMNV